MNNWISRLSDCWQVANSEIIGVGSDPLVFSDPDTPTDIQYASLLTWEGLMFHDGVVAVRMKPLLVSRGGAGGLLLRNVNDRTALIALLRQGQPDLPLMLELWRRESNRLILLKSTPFPADILTDDSYKITFQISRDTASVSAALFSDPSETLVSFKVHVQTDKSPGHFGLVKFSSGAVIFSDLRLTVHTRNE